jgi:solute carrier family 25 carnitine/acylcarnitine transporter 20/29
VLAAGLASSVARALIETPLELVKVRRQMGLGWLVAESAEQALRDPLRELRGLYRGLGVTFLRTWGLMGSFFVFVDVLERKHADLLAVPVLGPWMKGGVCTVAAWALVWPFEVIKNQVQASRGAEGDRRGWLARARAVLAERGLLGLYRGIGPGRECA